MSLILSQLIRIVGLSVLSPTVGAAALVTLHCLSRGAIVAMLAGLGPARREGMGAVAGQPWPLVVVLGLVLAVSPLLAWPPLIGIRLLLAATIGTLLVWRLARRHLGGYTGDILGTSQQISECACWIALAGVFR